MKKVKIYLSVLLAFLFLLPATDLNAQRRRKKKGKSDVTSYIDVYGSAGYSSILHGIDGSSIPGGGAGMVGFGYFMKHKSNFNFRVGLEAMYLNSSTVMDNLRFQGDFNYTDPLNNVPMEYHMVFDGYREQHNRLSVGLPVMFGAQFNRYYFLIGAKVNMGMMGTYSMKSPLTTYMVDPTLIDNLENMPNHTLTTSTIRHSGSINFGLDVTGSAEFGICLDEWMPSKSLSYKKGRSQMPISYRVGLFVDYGFLNINANKTEDIMLDFPGMESQGDGSYKVPANNLNQVQPRSLFASNYAAGAVLNPLVVGAKFSVLFQLSPKPKPAKKRPRLRPRPKTVNVVPDPNYFYCLVSDYDTEQPLDARIVLFDIDNVNDTILAVMTDPKTGFFQQEMENRRVGIKVTREGYIDHNDTLFQILSDTVYVDLQPIKKNTIVILSNLFFDTDKTTIRNTSAQSLEELYSLLLKNPEMRIRITGHTDNVGSRSYNMKLSRGRAKSVYDEMVKRGIDPDRMEWTGRGSLDPISDNDTPEGRAENRRVEFRIL